MPTVPDAAVRRKLLSTLRVENSTTYEAHGADLLQCGHGQREIPGYTALAQGVRWTQAVGVKTGY